MKRITLNKIKILALLLLGFISPVVMGQSIDSLVNEAMANNPQVKALQYKIVASEKRSESVDNLPAPSLGVEFSQVPISSVNVVNDAVSNNLTLSQMFPLGGKLNAMAEVERKNSAVEQSNLDAYKSKLIAKIKTSYYSLWLLDRKLEIENENITLLNNLVHSLETGYITNRVNQADILTLQSEIANEQTQLLIIRRQRESEIYNMNRWLGRKLDDARLFVSKQLDADSLMAAQSKLELMLARTNPSLKKIDAMTAMNEAMVDANSRELIPDVMVQGMIMRMPRGMLLTSKSNLSMVDPNPATMYSLMFSMNLPFAPWASGKIKAKEEELYAGIKSIKNEKTDMEREMLAELKAMVVKYQTAKDLTALYSDSVIPLYKKAADSQTSEYQNNRANVSAVMDAYRMLLMQQMNYYMAAADEHMAAAEIEMLIGCSNNADEKNYQANELR